MLTTRIVFHCVSEEFAIDSVCVEAEHRSGGQTGGAHREDEVAGLQRAVELRQALAVLGVLHEFVAQLGPERQQLGDLLVKLGVDGEYRHGGRGDRLGAIALAHQRPEPLLAFFAADEQDPQRVRVGHRRRPLGEFGDRPQLLVGDGLIGERVRRPAAVKSNSCVASSMTSGSLGDCVLLVVVMGTWGR